MHKPDVASSFPSIGRWLVTALPAGWLFVIGFGIRQMLPDGNAIAANVVLGQDTLEAPETLVNYIGRQAKMISEHLAEVKIAGPQPAAFQGAEEGYLFIVRHTPEGVETMIHVQNYVRIGNWIGIVTLTTPEAKLKSIRIDYDGFVKGLRILADNTPDS